MNRPFPPFCGLKPQTLLFFKSKYRIVSKHHTFHCNKFKRTRQLQNIFDPNKDGRYFWPSHKTFAESQRDRAGQNCKRAVSCNSSKTPAVQWRLALSSATWRSRSRNGDLSFGALQYIAVAWQEQWKSVQQRSSEERVQILVSGILQLTFMDSAQEYSTRCLILIFS